MSTPELETESSAPISHWHFKGHSDQFSVTLKPYVGLDFSRIAFLFCGQGQMSPGLMAEAIKANPFFQNRFNELDAVAAEHNLPPPSKYLSAPETPRTRQSELRDSSLCLFALQVGMFDTLLSVGIIPYALSSHSFGEFAQLTNAGVVSFRDMLRFLIARARHLEQVTDSFTMFVVNRPDGQPLGPLKAGEIQLANQNSPFQSAYVCKEKHFEGIRQELRAKRIACLKIPIDTPFHTSWLKPIRDSLQSELENGALRDIRFNPPKIPFVSSVSGALINRANYSADTIRSILVDQLVRPVDFPKQLQALRARGIAHFFEMSPQDVITDFVESTFDHFKAPRKVNSFRRFFKASSEGTKNYDRLKNSRFFSQLDKALKALTGYSIQQIRLEDRIRDDLGIDSIKKAEIVFEIIDTMSNEQIVTPANLSELSTFGDILEYLETARVSEEQNLSIKVAPESSEFALHELGWTQQPLPDYTSTAAPNLHVLDLRELRNTNVRQFNAAPEDVLVYSANGEIGVGTSQLRDWLLFWKNFSTGSRRWMLVHDGGGLGAATEALLNTLSQEREISFKSVRVQDSAPALTPDWVAKEFADFFNIRVLYRESQRFVRSLVPTPELHPPASARRVVVFGGLGGVGREIIYGLKDSGMSNLAIVGRKPLATVEDQLREFKNWGVSVTYHAVDVVRPDETRALLSLLESEWGGIDLLIHSVGVESSQLLNESDSTAIEQIISAKLTLAQELRDFIADKPSTRVILTSSVVSELASRGQAAYAAVNACLNFMAETTPRMLAILWPGWKNIGVAGQALNARSLQLQGAQMLVAEDGRKLFQKAMMRQGGSIAVIDRQVGVNPLHKGINRIEYLPLMKPASRDNSLFVVPGLTQAQLPYLTDHLVKRTCIFPASGSMALMLFRAYLERGQLGHLENFQAHNFLVVAPDTSNVSISRLSSDATQLSLQIKSHQLLASGQVVFDPSRKPERREFHFKSQFMGHTDYDHNVAVYTGPLFELVKHSFIGATAGSLLLDCDLEQAPVFMPIALLDKLHRLLELNFNTSHARASYEFERFTVPKSAQSISIFPEALEGHRFYTLVENLRPEGDLFICDLITLNSKLETAIWIQNLRSISVGSNKTNKTKGYQLTPCEREFF